MALFFILFIAILLIIQRYSLRFALHRVYYRCEASQNLVEPNEVFTLTSTVENRKKMIVPFVRMREYLPACIEFPESKLTIDKTPNSVQLVSRFYLMPKQVYQRKLKVHLTKRGCHYFHNTTLCGGDILGIQETIEYYRNSQEVVVIPASVTSLNLEKALGDYLGETSVNRFILEDPVLSIGFREYTGREPMRAISWTQTARFGRVMVKNYDHTLDQSMTVLLNVKTPQYTEESDALVEQCFSLVRAVCEQLEEQQVKYKFSTNASISGFAGSWADISEGLGPRHFQTVMEGLGRATTLATESFSNILDRAYRQAERGRSFIIVTPQEDEDWLPELRKLRELSAAPVLILTPEILSQEDHREEAMSA